MTMNNVMAFVLVVSIVMVLSFLFVFLVVLVAISILFFEISSVAKAKTVQGYSIYFIPKVLPQNR